MVDIEWRLESIGTFLQGKEKNPDSVAEVQIRFGTVVVALQSNTQGVSTEEKFSLQGSFKDTGREFPLRLKAAVN